MTIRSVERESGKCILDIPPGTTVHLAEKVLFSKDSLYGYLDAHVSLVSLPKREGYWVDIQDAPTLGFSVWPGSIRHIKTETTIYIAT